MKAKLSPKAARELMDYLVEEDPDGEDADGLSGNTDCVEGCVVEPDGECPHAFLSAFRTLEEDGTL